MPVTKIAFMRHGKAEEIQSLESDIERNLVDRGKQEVTEAAHWLANTGFKPDQIVCSNANRTYQTAEICADVLGFQRENIIQKKQLYNASVNQYLNDLEKYNSGDQVLIVGHNPAMSQLANFYSDNKFIHSFPTSSIAVVEFENNYPSKGTVKHLYERS